MKTTLFLIVIIFFNFGTYSQVDNPFRSIGKKGEIITLSNGKYQEVHPYDSLQKIGSVIVNMNTGMIYKIIESDTLYSESTLDPTIISRWYSPDPLQSKYPGWSPYNFANNNPIYYIDPDGRDVIPSKAFQGNEQLMAMLSLVQKTDVYNSLVANYLHGTEDLYLGYNPNYNRMVVAKTDFYQAGVNNSFPRTFSVTAFYNFENKEPASGYLLGHKTLSNELLSSVLFHEIIHANINLYEYVNPDLGDARYSKMCDYRSKYSDEARAEHEFIADNFRQDISNGLKEMDKVQNSPLRDDKYYNAMAWGGLQTYKDESGDYQETDAWKKFKETASNEEIEYINKTLTEENSRYESAEK